jgi:predicted MFS family arabinose efflux permease
MLCALLFTVLAPVPAPGTPRRAPTGQWTQIRAALAQSHLRRLYLQGLLLTGVMVSFYSLIGFRLAAAPFDLSPTLTAFVFLAYFAGTVSSRAAGSWLPRIGFVRTDLVALALAVVGLGLTLIPQLAVVVTGVVLFTAGFFLAHSAAVTTVGATSAPQSRSQASALYTLFFYLGSGVVGGLVALTYDHAGWPVLIGVMGLIVVLCALSALTTRVRRPEQDGAVPAPATAEPQPVSV